MGIITNKVARLKAKIWPKESKETNDVLTIPKLLKTEDTAQAEDVLYHTGRSLIILNMILGLLPVSLHRKQIRHSQCSLSSLYALCYFAAVCYVSTIFLPLNTEVYYKGLTQRTAADTSINVAQTAHIVGYGLLIVRGRFIARGFPRLWQKLSYAFQKCVVNLHGKRYQPMRTLRRISRRCVLFYVLAIIINSAVLWDDIDILYLESDVTLKDTVFEALFSFGYIVWYLSTVSHVLVSMLLVYFLFALQMCLRSLNDRLRLVAFAFRDQLAKENEQKGEIEGFVREEEEKTEVEASISTAVSIASTITVASKEATGTSPSDRTSTKVTEEDLKEAIDYTLHGYRQVEKVVGELNFMMGASIVVEVLILLGNVIANIYFLFIRSILREFVGHRSDESTMGRELSNRNDTALYRWFEPLANIFCHAIFFYWLAFVASDLNHESKKPIRILKDVNYELSWKMETKIHRFKADIKNTKVTLSARGFFSVDMALLTSIFNAVLTFVVVLIQFKTSALEEYPDDTAVNVSISSTTSYPQK